MKVIAKTLLFFGFALAVLAGCKPQPEGPQPPEIRYGQEACSACGMVIDDPRFAAATLLVSGEYLKFDDVGEMLSYHMNHPQDQVAAWFVHDYPTEKWIRGEQAFFVKSQGLQTPMGSGTAAFAHQVAAESFAAERNGEVFSLDKIRAQTHIVEHP
jgi:copper chaperone NosL